MAKQLNQKNQNRKFHNERFERYVTEENGGFWPPQTAEEKAALQTLCAELIGIDTPEMKAHRIAVEGPQAYIENSPELYGKSLAETVRKYYNGGSFVECKNDCDCELDETSAAIVNSTLHLGDVEKPI